MIITLVGYRGSGKSSVAPALAARLGWHSVDADSEIERRSGCTIREIFREQGEPGFRRIERDVISDLLTRRHVVLAAGGGAVLSPETRRHMTSAGPVIWLQASVETILERVRADSASGERRPSLTDGDPRTEVESLLAVREPLYREVATIAISTDDRPLKEIVDEIVARLPPPVREERLG
jgi:shikimate kinase